jgi:hypothetical protein
VTVSDVKWMHSSDRTYAWAVVEQGTITAQEIRNHRFEWWIVFRKEPKRRVGDCGESASLEKAKEDSLAALSKIIKKGNK